MRPFLAGLIVLTAVVYGLLIRTSPPENHTAVMSLSGGVWAVLDDMVAPTTTTTLPEPPTTTQPPEPPRVVATSPPVTAAQQWPTSLQPCGGDLPPCYVKQRESGGSYSARNPSGACGAWQIIPSTWAGFGGYQSACDAPPDVQDEKARALWNGGAGCSHWSAC